VHVSGSYLASTPDGAAGSIALMGEVEETLSPRLTVSELLNDSNGQKTVGFGGAFLSNVATVSVDYQTYYVPARPEAPFEQAVIVDVSLNVGGSIVHGGTFVSPAGKLLYTADAREVIARETSAGSAPRSRMGVMVLRGRVIDPAGRPVMGAALRIDQASLFTDSQGYFCLRERRRQSHPLVVVVGDFLDGGRYRVVSAPGMIVSGVEDEVPETVIVVAPV
jgi:hypothetical protein